MLPTVRRAPLLICDTRDFDIAARDRFRSVPELGLIVLVLVISGIERLSFGELVRKMPENIIWADFGVICELGLNLVAMESLAEMRFKCEPRLKADHCH